MENTYQLLDSGDFRKLEKIGPYKLIRPAASAVWNPALSPEEWTNGLSAEFIRHRDGTGEWKTLSPALKDAFTIDIENLKFQIKLTSFGHLGIFPEQHANWRRFDEILKKFTKSGRPSKVLNLFAYTGGSTLACARAGAEVTHVDASKGTVKWAQENARLSGLETKPIRWLVDDVKDFVSREVRRESVYDGIILDPPSYGKGDKKQVWKIEVDLMPLLKSLKKILSDREGSFVCLSAHSEAYTPTSLGNQLTRVFGPGSLVAEEMLITERQNTSLPSGATALWCRS